MMMNSLELEDKVMSKEWPSEDLIDEVGRNGGDDLQLPITFEGDEALTILMEECGEVVQAASKYQRFGGHDKLADLSKEIGDMLCVVDILVEQGYLNVCLMMETKENKRKKLKIYSSVDLGD